MLGRLEQGQRRLPPAAQLVQTVQQGFPEAPPQPVGRHLEDLLQPPDAQPVQPLAGAIRQAGTSHRHPGQQYLQLCRIGGLQAILQPGQQMGRPGKGRQRDAMAELQIRQLAPQPFLEGRPPAHQPQAAAHLQNKGLRPGRADLMAEAIGPGRQPLLPARQCGGIMGQGDELGMNGTGHGQLLADPQPATCGSRIDGHQAAACGWTIHQHQRCLRIGLAAPDHVQRQLRQGNAGPQHGSGHRQGNGAGRHCAAPAFQHLQPAIGQQLQPQRGRRGLGGMAHGTQRHAQRLPMVGGHLQPA